MKATIITEIVKFKVLATVSNEQLMLKVDVLNDFQKEQDGFIDSELVKDMKDDEWSIIYHFENMEKFKAIGEKLRSSTVFSDFTSVIQPGSLGLTFTNQLKTW